MTDEKMTKGEAKKKFGFDPETIGREHVEWWIVDTTTQISQGAGARFGDLGVRTNDGDEPDKKALAMKNFRGMFRRRFFSTGKIYYYFKPLPEKKGPGKKKGKR